MLTINREIGKTPNIGQTQVIDFFSYFCRNVDVVNPSKTGFTALQRLCNKLKSN